MGINLRAWRGLMGILTVSLCFSCGSKVEPKISLEPPKSLESGDKKLIKSVAFSPDGKFIITGGQNKKIKIIDLPAGQTSWESAEQPDAVLSVAFSPDGKYFAATCGDNTQNTAQIVVYDAATKTEVWGKKGLTNDVQWVKFSPDGKTVAAANYFSVTFYEAATGKQTYFFSGHPMEVAAPYGHVGAVTDIAFSTADPNKFVTVGWDRNVKIWDLTEGHEIKTFPEADPINACFMFADDRKIVTAGTGSIHVWNRETNLTDTIIGYEGDIQAMCGIRDKEYFITGDETGKIVVWKTADYSVVREWPRAHQMGVWSLNASADGKYFVSAGGDGRVTVWNLDYAMSRADSVNMKP